MNYSLYNINTVTAEHINTNTSLNISDGIFSDIKQDIQIDGQDFLAFPSFINIHTHLFSTYYPKVGFGPYLSWKSWDNDLKASPLYTERNKNSLEDIYLLGCYANILGGTVHVVDHMPRFFLNSLDDKLFPIEINHQYGVSHEISSYDLSWGDVDKEYKYAKENNYPFITHLCEGFDTEATLGVQMLNQLNALDESSVLIHMISCNNDSLEKIAQAQAHIVWCPSSNLFMFNQTLNIHKISELGISVSIGSDSPMSGNACVLSEAKEAREYYLSISDDDLSPSIWLKMLIDNPTNALRLKNTGQFSPNYQANFTIMKKNKDIDFRLTPFTSELSNVELVVRNGIPLYGTTRFQQLFNESEYQLVNLFGENRYLIGQPIDLMQRIHKNAGFKKEFPFFPIEGL